MKIIITENYDEMSIKAARMVSSQITLKNNSVLGLATGSTPEGMYRELINMYNNKEISFNDIITFNLDEYYNLEKDNTESYDYFMRKNLFNHIDINKKNIHIPNGMTEDIDYECINYDNMIKSKGGIDMQILGIGGNGHIGFNEPNINFEATTHLVNLTEDTIEANSRFFDSIEEVPTKAISMGVKTIMNSRKIILLANGKGKAEAIYNAVKGKITPTHPASVLQLHNDVTLILDKEAAALL